MVQARGSLLAQLAKVSVGFLGLAGEIKKSAGRSIRARARKSLGLEDQSEILDELRVLRSVAQKTRERSEELGAEVASLKSRLDAEETGGKS